MPIPLSIHSSFQDFIKTAQISANITVCNTLILLKWLLPNMDSVYVQFIIPMHRMQKRSLNDFIILTISHLGLLLCSSYIQLAWTIWLILIVHLNQWNNADAKDHVGSVVNNPANSSVKTAITLHFKTSAKRFWEIKKKHLFLIKNCKAESF